jgi:hypothetical protein
MGVLIVPPVDFEPQHVEIPASIKKSAQDYVNTLLGQLNIIPSSPTTRITTGGFLGSALYSWPHEGDYILAVSFIQKSTLSKKEQPSIQNFFKQAAWIRHKDCVVLGHVWEWADKENTGISPSLNEVVSRVPQDITPVRIAFRHAAQDILPLEDTFLPIMEESLAKKGIPVHLGEDSLACQWNPPGISAPPAVADSSIRTQQVISFQIQEQTPSSSSLKTSSQTSTQKPAMWPDVKYEVSFISGIFGYTEETFLSQKENIRWDPSAVADKVMKSLGAIPGGHFVKLSPGADTLSTTIIARDGAWVYLDKGKAFGLDIGMRLVGPQKEKLHIIRYAPGFQGKDDISIAFIRWENKSKPLAVGDALSLDKP